MHKTDDSSWFFTVIYHCFGHYIQEQRNVATFLVKSYELHLYIEQLAQEILYPIRLSGSDALNRYFQQKLSLICCMMRSIYIWTSLYRPYASTFLSIYFNSHNLNQIGPFEAHIRILILQCYISFHPIFTLYVLYSDLRSNKTIPLKTCTKIRPTPCPGVILSGSAGSWSGSPGSIRFEPE